MEKEKYSGYSLEELLEDQEFINTILKIKTVEEWNNFLQSNISVQDNILRARKIIDLFKTSGEELPGDKKLVLWKRIDKYNQYLSRRIYINRITRIAASVLLIMALGGAIYWIVNPHKDSYTFPDSQIAGARSPVLVLSDGKQIRLSGKESKIVVLKNQNAILVNNDSIIKNAPSGLANKKTMLNEMNVPYGEKASLVLADGTKIQLNTGSRLLFPQAFSGQKREVYLEGEGYFEVAKSRKQPFIVSTRKMDVKVLGTKFNLSAYQTDDFCETVLLEGHVEIQSKGKIFNDKVNLTPNQKATYYSNSGKIVRTDVSDPAIYIAWTDGWYKFSNENLAKVLDKLERYYNLNFVYDQSLVQEALPISGKLDLKGSINDVMKVLAGVAKIEYKISGKNVIITKTYY